MALEVQKLLQEGVIEPSNSPWRAQAFVIRGENHKLRLVVHYSQTINKYTLLDAYPSPKIEEVILKISKNKIVRNYCLHLATGRTIHTRSGSGPTIYIEEDLSTRERETRPGEERSRVAARKNSGRRKKDGWMMVTNGIACFQRVIDKIIEDEGIVLTYPLVDDVTVRGKDQKEPDDNLEKFMTVTQKYNLTQNEYMCTYSSNSVHMLGYIIQDGIIKPDPERLKPLRDMPVPKDSFTLQRALGMFAHYCRWIPGFSQKIHPFLRKKQFPLSRDAVLTFNSLKDDVANAALATIKDDIPFRMETDFAMGVPLSQVTTYSCALLPTPVSKYLEDVKCK
ncbi:retrovirus-related Pol polyprotein from transposon opus [Trichonephila clavipes]|nr:retrovirus-related Pol polyprotein from transposon opus [Trichonephila clavipes]